MVGPWVWEADGSVGAWTRMDSGHVDWLANRTPKAANRVVDGTRASSRRLHSCWPRLIWAAKRPASGPQGLGLAQSGPKINEKTKNDFTGRSSKFSRSRMATWWLGLFSAPQQNNRRILWGDSLDFGQTGIGVDTSIQRKNGPSGGATDRSLRWIDRSIQGHPLADRSIKRM